MKLYDFTPTMATTGESGLKDTKFGNPGRRNPGSIFDGIGQCDCTTRSRRFRIMNGLHDLNKKVLIFSSRMCEKPVNPDSNPATRINACIFQGIIRRKKIVEAAQPALMISRTRGRIIERLIRNVSEGGVRQKSNESIPLLLLSQWGWHGSTFLGFKFLVRGKL